MGQLVQSETHDGVAVVSFNRPEKHNALNNALVAEHRAALREVLDDPSVRCVVLRGEGQSFSSGRDTTELGGRPRGESDYAWVRESQELRFAMMHSSKIVIAALKGYTLGGSFELALASDIRIGASGVQMALPEINYGILPDTGGTQLLTALVGPGRAKELILTGRRMGAEEGLAWGVLNRVVDEEELDAEVMALATTVASKSPLALSIGKELIDQVWADEINRGIRAEVVAQAVLFASEDYAEARSARRENRDPRFIGK